MEIDHEPWGVHWLDLRSDLNATLLRICFDKRLQGFGLSLLSSPLLFLQLAFGVPEVFKLLCFRLTQRLGLAVDSLRPRGVALVLRRAGFLLRPLICELRHPRLVPAVPAHSGARPPSRRPAVVQLPPAASPSPGRRRGLLPERATELRLPRSA